MRLTVILPRHRLWHWHLDLLDRLRDRGIAVSVVLDDGAAPLALSVRTWLKVERLRLGARTLAEPDAKVRNWPHAATDDARGDRIVLNLAERELEPERGLELRFDGALDSQTLIDVLLRRGQPTLEVRCIGSDAVPASSRPAIENKLYLSLGLESCFSRAVSLILRAVDRMDRDAVPPARSPAPARRGSLPAFVCRSLVEQSLTRAVRPIRHPDHWITALRVAGGPFLPIDDDGERYYADPFLWDRDGRRFLFVEEFVHASRRGHISAAEIRGDRLLAPPVPVLRRPYHLSYPLVFSHAGSHFMLPESGANRSVDLYRCEADPWSWEKVATLLEGRRFADATPLYHRGLWWLFVAADDHGTATQDELQIHFSDRLTGPYEPHPMNPVRSDCRFARPAGRIRRHDGRLLRPAQDCEANYGAGIAWFVIEELSPTAYRESLLTTWNGPRDFGMRGVHSFDQAGDVQAIDLNGPRQRGRFRRDPVSPRSGDCFETGFLARDETAGMFAGDSSAPSPGIALMA